MKTKWPLRIFAVTAVAVAILILFPRPRVDWPGIHYSEVRGYLYNLEGLFGTPILRHDQLHESVVNTNGVRLAQKQIEKLLDAVARPHRKHLKARCYMPRHAFVFYNEAKMPVACVEICFECSSYRTSPELSHPFDLSALKRLCLDLKLPVLPRAEDYTAFKSGGQKP